MEAYWVGGPDERSRYLANRGRPQRFCSNAWWRVKFALPFLVAALGAIPLNTVFTGLWLWLYLLALACAIRPIGWVIRKLLGDGPDFAHAVYSGNVIAIDADLRQALLAGIALHGYSPTGLRGVARSDWELFGAMCRKVHSVLDNDEWLKLRPRVVETAGLMARRYRLIQQWEQQKTSD